MSGLSCTSSGPTGPTGPGGPSGGPTGPTGPGITGATGPTGPAPIGAFQLTAIPGIVFDGTTDNYAMLLAAISAAGQTLTAFGITGPMAINTSIIIPSNIQLWFANNGRIIPATSVIITINGAVVAGSWQIFDCINSGAVIGGTMDVSYILPEWWGALSDGSANSATRIAVQACEDYFKQSNTPLGTICFSGANYYFDAQITTSNGSYVPQWFTPSRSTLTYPFGTANAVRLIDGSSGLSIRRPCMSGFVLNGDSNTYAIEMRGIDGYTIEYCEFQANALGVLFHNHSTGQFTEHNIIDNCKFRSNCLQWWAYKVTSGNNSFHESGATRCQGDENASGTVALVAIGTGCFPYDCPWDVQVAKQTTKPIVDHDGNANSWFYGSIRYEKHGAATACEFNNPTKTKLYFLPTAGPQALGQLDFNNVELLARIQVNADSSINFLRSSYSRVLTLAANAGSPNTVFSSVGGETGYLSLYIAQGGLEWEGTYKFFKSDQSSNAYITTIDTQLIGNSSSFGSPTIAITSGGIVTLTMGGSYTGVTAYKVYVDYRQIGTRRTNHFES